MSENKQKIINDVYFDKGGFGSRALTLKEARQKDKSITMNDINEFFKNNVEEKRKPRGENSFVAPHAYYQYQADLFFIKDLDNQKTRVGFLMIDIFSKYMVVLPLPSKDGEDVASGFIEGIKKMGKKPQFIYTDDETSFSTSYLQKYFKDEGIQHYITRGHAPFAEVAIKTFKTQLYKRVEADEKKNKKDIQWTDYIFEILLTYNNKMEHSTTSLTPNEARKPRNEFNVKLNISTKAVKKRVYPDLEVNDKVKLARKKGITEKQQTSHWLKEIFTITKIEKKMGQTYYHLEGRNQPYLRHELLKV